MGIEGLDYRIIHIPLASGLKTKDDARAMQPPGMSICTDARFDELGGIQTRFPSVMLGNGIFGGGTLSNVRRIEPNGGEFVLFTDTQLYAWNAQMSKWVLRGSHLAVAVDEASRFVTPGDQIDGDRAELNGTVVFAWTEGSGTYLAASDKTTGAVLLAPTLLGAGIVRPRLVAADTKIFAFIISGTTLLYAIVDPANPGAASFTTFFTGVGGPYDAVRIEGSDGVCGAHQRTVTTAYTVWTVTSANVIVTLTKARTCDGPIAIASASANVLQVVRAFGALIQGDIVATAGLGDLINNIAIGTAAVSPPRQIAVAYPTASLAWAFWTSGSETSSLNDFTVEFNSITTSGVVGTQATFRHRLGIASRAFGYAGHAYVWLAFASDSGTSIHGNSSGVRAQLQNTYFLYRDDGTIHARCAYSNGGGFAATAGRLPGVALIGGSTDFAWCATTRRRIDLGGSADHTGFGSRSPRDVAFTFDDDRARRCARLGATLYITASIPLQYDGVQLAEVGFLYYPWYFDPLAVGAGSGLLLAGTYTWKATMAWTNAQGELDRSTTATGMSLTVPNLTAVLLSVLYLNVTSRTGVRAPAIDIWRTPVNPLADSPFYLVSSQDPNAGIVANGYVRNVDADGVGVALPDNFADATLISKETNPENGAVLEYLAPPGAQIIFATDTRIFLAGVSGDPDSVWYSRLRRVGEVASFHDGLTIPIPPDIGAGPITALAYLNETLIVFRAGAIYALSGLGFDNTAGGQNFGPANRLSSVVGAVSAESVVLVPRGLIFKSAKGWYLLENNWNTRYIGADVAKFDAETVLAAHVAPAYHQARFVTSGRILVLDYLTDRADHDPLGWGNWSSWSIGDAVHAAVWNGTYYYLSSSSAAPFQEQASYPTGSVNYGLDVELGWIKPADLQGAVKIDQILILGEHRGVHALRIRTAFDYQQDAAGNAIYTDDVYWTPSPAVIGKPLQVSRGTSRGRCEAIKIRITAASTAKDGTPPTTEAIKLTGLALRVGFRKTETAYKRLPAAQKT